MKKLVRTVFGVLGLGMAVEGPAQDLSVRDEMKSFLVYEIQPDDTLKIILQKFWSQTNGMEELLRYNEMEDAREIQAGDYIAIPMQNRRTALRALDASEIAFQAAEDAKATDYAEKEFKRAKRLLEGAIDARKNAAYDQAEAKAGLATRSFRLARDLADKRAVVQEDARIRVVYGKVEFLEPNGLTWKTAKKDQGLKGGSEVRTLAGARAEIELADGSIIQLLEQARLRIDQQNVDKRDGKRDTELEVMLGGILGKIKPKKVKKSSFKVKSLGSSLGIRGTEFRISADEERTTRLSVLEGRTVMSADGRDRDVATNFGTYVKPNEPPVWPRKLLPPPLVTQPEKKELNTARQSLRVAWKVPFAPVGSKYHFELAQDADFNQILENRITENLVLNSRVLGKGTYYLRLSSIDRDGLEGPSTTNYLVNIVPDLNAQAFIETNFVQRGGVFIVGPSTKIQLKPAKPDTSVVGYQVRFNDGAFTASSDTFPLVEDGLQTISFRGVGLDKATGSVVSIKARLDREAPKPRVDLTYHTAAENKEDTLLLRFTAEDDTQVRQIEYSFDGRVFKTYVTPVGIGHLGASDIRFRSVDAVGNWSKIHTLHLMGAF